MSQEPVTGNSQKENMNGAQPPTDEVQETNLDKEVDVENGKEALDTDIEDSKPHPPNFESDDLRHRDAGTPFSRTENTSQEEIIRTLRTVREDVGQICELSAEEEKIVEAFFIALLRLMKPLAKAIPVDTSALPRELGDIKGANIIPEGNLIVLYDDGRMEAIDLRNEANRDLMLEIIKNVMPKFNDLIAELRAKIEGRMGLLASITGELQNIAEAFSSAVG